MGHGFHIANCHKLPEGIQVDSPTGNVQLWLVYDISVSIIHDNNDSNNLEHLIISNLLDNPIYFPMGFASTVGYMSMVSIPCFPVVAFKTSVYMIYSIKSS